MAIVLVAAADFTWQRYTLTSAFYFRNKSQILEGLSMCFACGLTGPVHTEDAY